MTGKKRRIRLHRVLSLVVAIILTVIIAVALFRRSGLLSYQVSSYINEHYLDGTPFHFTSGKISGDLVGQVSIADPVLRYREGGQVIEVFRANSITLNYSLLQVLRLRLIVRHLDLDGVNVRVVEDDNGKPILPSLGGSSDETRASVQPHIDIEKFLIRDMDVTYASRAQTTHLHNADFVGSLRFSGGVGEIEIDRGALHIVENEMPLRSIQLKGRFGEDGLTIDDLQLRTERSFVRVSGRYADGRLHHVQGVFNPLDLADISALGLANERGELGGNVVVEGVPDSLAVKASLTGKAIGLAFSGLTLEGVVLPNTVKLSNVAGTLFGSRLNGDVSYDRNSGSYAFRGVCEGLDISSGFISGNVPTTDLNGLIQLEYDAPRKTYQVRGDLRRSVIEGFESEELQAQLKYREATGLEIQSATLRRRGFELIGSGTLDEKGHAEMILALEGDSLDYLLDYVSLPRIGGRAELQGRLVGPLDRFQLNLNGRWNNLAYVFGQIDSSRVYAEAKHVGSEDLVAALDIQGQRLDLSGQKFDKPHVLIRATAGDVEVRDFSFARGDTFISSHFEVLPGDGRQDILIKHLVVRMPHSSWVNERPARLVVDEESATLDTLRLRSIGRQIGVVGSYRMQDRLIDIDGWGNEIDLQLVREAMGLPFVFEALGEFETRIYGDIDNPMMDLSVELGRGQVDSLTFDVLRLDGSFSEKGYVVDELVVIDKSDSILVTGSWGYMDSPLKVVREGFRKENAQHAAITINAKGRRYPLVALLRAAHQRPYWGGALDGTVTVRNTLAAPEIAVDGKIVSRAEDRYRLPPITTALRYGDGELSIEELSFDDGSTAASASGTVRMDLGLVEGLVFEDDAPIDVRIAASSRDLSAVARYFEIIAVSGGKLEAAVDIDGTASNPVYSGALTVEEGILRLMGTQETYRRVKAVMDIEDSRLDLKSLSGEVGKKGRFSASGFGRIRLFSLGDYDLDVNLTDYTFLTVRDVESTQDGRLRLQSVAGADGRVIPFISGRIDVKQAVITKSIGRDEGPPSTFGLPTETPGWMCSIDIDAPKNVWLRNPDLNMEMSGDLILKRDTKGLYFRGDLTVLRGSYTLYNNKFRITDGRINFSTETTLRPDISLSAYTPHRVSGQQEHRIFLDLTWPSDKKEPTIALSYDAPGYSETDLWKMLGGQVVTGSGAAAGGAIGTATGTAQNLASNYLERILNAQMRDVTVEVESRPLSGTSTTPNGERELTIAVGRYLSEDLYLKYQQGLSVTSAREVDIEYRISNLFLIRSEIIKHQNPRGIAGGSRQTTDEINLDFKFRIEY